MNAIFERTSTRDFSNKPIKKKLIKKLLKAGMAAPSAGNQQPWEFIVVDDPNLLKILTSYSPYSKPVGKSKVSIIMLMRQSSLRFPALTQQDMGACAENILLEATELGLGSVWQCVYPEQERIDYIVDMFSIPEGLVPFAVISLGYPKKGKMRKQQDRYDKTRISWNAYEGTAPTLDSTKGQGSDAAKQEARTNGSDAAEAAASAQENTQEAADKPRATGWRSASNATL